MHIKINKNSVYALGVVLSNFSDEMSDEIDNAKGNLTSLNTYFLDPSYDNYSSEYIKELQELSEQCNELQRLAQRVSDYSKKLADV